MNYLYSSRTRCIYYEICIIYYCVVPVLGRILYVYASVPHSSSCILYKRKKTKFIIIIHRVIVCQGQIN